MGAAQGASNPAPAGDPIESESPRGNSAPGATGGSQQTEPGHAPKRHRRSGQVPGPEPTPRQPRRPLPPPPLRPKKKPPRPTEPGARRPLERIPFGNQVIPGPEQGRHAASPGQGPVFHIPAHDAGLSGPHHVAAGGHAVQTAALLRFGQADGLGSHSGFPGSPGKGGDTHHGIPGRPKDGFACVRYPRRVRG